MTAVVTDLPLEEPARFNPSQLEQLCKRIGEVRAETEVALALDRIALQLGQLRNLNAEHRGTRARIIVRSLGNDARLIGMASLARVADDVVQCLSEADEVAFAATFARLLRVGDRSIHAVWDFDDVSG